MYPFTMVSFKNQNHYTEYHPLVSSVVCLKNDDKMVSDKIHLHGSWEKETVTKVMRTMEMYEDAVFIGNERWKLF